MPFNTIDEAWADFKRHTLGPAELKDLQADPDADRALQRIFLAGAAGVFGMLTKKIDGLDRTSVRDLLTILVDVKDHVQARVHAVTPEDDADDDAVPAVPIVEPIAYDVRNTEIEAKLREIATVIDGQCPTGWGFTLLLFEFAPRDSLFYISNAQRADMIKGLQNFLNRQVS